MQESGDAAPSPLRGSARARRELGASSAQAWPHLLRAQAVDIEEDLGLIDHLPQAS
jgi:hypothetical protein